MSQLFSHKSSSQVWSLKQHFHTHLFTRLTRNFQITKLLKQSRFQNTALEIAREVKENKGNAA